jgi:protein-disulfide isomerase
MFGKEKQKKYILIAFVIAAIIVFMVMVFSAFIFLADLRYSDSSASGESADAELASDNDRLFLNEESAHKDPYTTKVPQLEDMLAGPIISASDPSLGDANSPLTLVLFSDFECAYCANQEKIIKDAVNKYGLRLVWKDYPTNDQKSRAYQAALAARCAQSENAFWPYHDELYAGSSALDRDSFIAIAAKLNLDTEAFARCLDNSEKSALVYDNMVEAEALGIDAIPFLYVNDQEIMGEVSKEDLERIIERQLAK